MSLALGILTMMDFSSLLLPVGSCVVGYLILKYVFSESSTPERQLGARDRVDANGMQRNWFGNQTWKPKVVRTPENLEQLLDVIKEAKEKSLRVRAIGALHSWSSSAEINDGIQVQMYELRHVLNVDHDNMLVKAQAGMRLGDFYDVLTEHKMALPTLPNDDSFLLGGCISNSVHGTTSSAGTFSSFIEELELVTASGEVLTLRKSAAEGSQEKNRFEAAVVSIGNAGIIYSMTFKTVPFYNVIVHQKMCDYDYLEQNAHKIAFDYPSVLMFINPFNDYAYTKIQIPIDENLSKAVPRSTSTDYGLELFLYRHKPGKKKFWKSLLAWAFANESGRKWLEARNLEVTKVQSWYDGEILVKSWQDRVLLNMEYALPAENTTEAVIAVRNLYHSYKKKGYVRSVGFTLRPTGADSVGFMSPTKGRKTVYFDFPHQQMDEIELEFYRDIEKALIALGGRASWSRYFESSGKEVLSNYPEADKYIATIKELDPQRMFSNSFSQKMFDF